ncbi:GIY-YIG nuclease family protein [Streptomyces scabiei]|uniref:GIY-YIG nuclease family protein n=1 Tax=Streptomyces scabiei TaxID=1930 RepID=UPI0039F670AF
MSEGHVYVIAAPGSSVVKIGQSGDPAKRLSEIQRMSPVRLAVLWSQPGADLEVKLHRHFAHLRTHGEWFDFGTEDPVRAVQEALIERPWEKRDAKLSKRPRPLQDGKRQCQGCGHRPHRGDLCWSEGCYDTGADAFPVCSCPVEPVRPSA